MKILLSDGFRLYRPLIYARENKYENQVRVNSDQRRPEAGVAETENSKMSDLELSKVLI